MFWRRPIDSLVPSRSPATRAGLTVYPPASQHGVFSSRVGDTKKNTRRSFDLRVLCSGDVLLSHGLSPYYHRGCSVSLPCSEWERVGPLRYCHQRFAPNVGANLWRRRCARRVNGERWFSYHPLFTYHSSLFT
jgi:hypothetical protein